MVDLYESFYGLERDPFRLSADHTFAYPHGSYRKALSYLKFAAYRKEGFVMVTGKPGTGKTTLIAEILSGLNRDKVVTATLVTTQLESHDLLQMVASAFGLEYRDASKSSLLLRIERFLRDNHDEGRRAILLVDEAQGLTLDAIEELRQLSNIVVDGCPVLQTFLIGQDELRELVRSPQLDQLRQRIVASSHLEPLSAEEVTAYVRHRLLAAGWKNNPRIANSVLALVHHYSGGIPRKINLIMGRLLLHGFTEGRHELVREDMEAVIRELETELLIFNVEAGERPAGLAEHDGFLEVAPEPEDGGHADGEDGDSEASLAPAEGEVEQEDAAEPQLPPDNDPITAGAPDDVPGEARNTEEGSRKVNYVGGVLVLLLLLLALAGMTLTQRDRMVRDMSTPGEYHPPAPVPQDEGAIVAPDAQNPLKSGLIHRDLDETAGVADKPPG